MNASPWRAELDLEAANNVFFLHLLVKTLSSIKNFIRKPDDFSENYVKLNQLLQKCIIFFTILNFYTNVPFLHFCISLCGFLNCLMAWSIA